MTRDCDELRKLIEIQYERNDIAFSVTASACAAMWSRFGRHTGNKYCIPLSSFGNTRSLLTGRANPAMLLCYP